MSEALSSVARQPLPEFTNTYTAPAFEAWLGAPTTTVLPETATESPNKSPTAVPGPSSWALSCQPVGVLTNTYARPNPEERTDIAGAPTTMLWPDTATESPNQSGPLVSGLFNSALSCQPVAVLTKTYARPKPDERRGAAGAPTTVVVLDTATDVPNQSPGTVPEPASSASCLPTGGAARWPATAHAGPVFVTPANPVIVPAATTTALTRLFSLTVSFCATCSQGATSWCWVATGLAPSDTP